MAAGSNVMKLLGVVPNDVVLSVHGTKTKVNIILKNAVIVKNLGPSVLIGEPGKMDNNIVTFPKQKLIQLVDIYGRNIKLPYHSLVGPPVMEYQPFSVKQNIVLYPGETLHIPVPPSMQCNAVSATLRRDYTFNRS